MEQTTHIRQWIRNAQQNRQWLCELIVLFDPLLKKYARLLAYEDAYAELRMTLIELVLAIDVMAFRNRSDGAYIHYIRRSLHHSYIQLSRSYRRYTDTHVFYQDIQVAQESFSTDVLPVCMQEDPVDISLILAQLTPREYETIVLLFYYGYSTKEIAAKRHVSRQAVNQRKLQALRKLRQALRPEPDAIQESETEMCRKRGAMKP